MIYTIDDFYCRFIYISITNKDVCTVGWYVLIVLSVCSPTARAICKFCARRSKCTLVTYGKHARKCYRISKTSKAIITKYNSSSQALQYVSCTCCHFF